MSRCIERLELRLLMSAYSVVDLGTLGGIESTAFDINDNNQVVGWAKNAAGNNRAFRFQDLNSNGLADSGEMEDLGVLAGFSQSYAYGINNAGSVVGTVVSVANVKKAVSFQPGASPVDLGLGNGSNAYAINSSGTIVGAAVSGNRYAAFSRTSAGTVTNYQSLSSGSGSYSEAMGINDSGVIAGYSSTNAGDTAFIINAAPMAAIGFSPQPGGLAYGYAWDINQSGQIVGEGFNSLGQYRAFRYFAGLATDLGTIDGYANSRAFGINDAGQVVGRVEIASGPTHAFIFKNGVMSNLNDLIPAGSGWVLNEARAINDNGYIVGKGVSPSGQTRAFLLVPGPAAITVAGDAGGVAIDDHIILRRSAITPGLVEVLVNSITPTSTFQAVDSAQLIIDAGAGNDVLEFDLSNGIPLPLGGAVLNGQGGALDTLKIVGAATQDQINVTPANVDVGGTAIAYATVERLVLECNDGTDLVTLGSGLAPDLVHLGIDAGGGDDRIELAGTLPMVPALLGGDGADQLVFSGGNHAIAGNLAGASFETLALAGAANVNLGDSQLLSVLSLAGQSRLTLASDGGRVIRVAELALADQAVLDLTDNNLIVDAGFMQSTVLQSVTGWIITGRSASIPWTTPAITGATAPRRGLAAIANIDRSWQRVVETLEGHSVGADAVLVKYTWDGDANLSGLVDIDDYHLIDVGYSLGLSGYLNGDFNYDLAITADDYYLIDLAFIQQAGALAVATSPTPPLDLFANQADRPTVF